jgi:hypothetical protein
LPAVLFDTIKFSAAAMQRLGRDAAREKIVTRCWKPPTTTASLPPPMGSRPTRRRARQPVRPAPVRAAHVPALLSVPPIAVA